MRPKKIISLFFLMAFYENMDNCKQLGTRFILMHGQENTI